MDSKNTKYDDITLMQYADGELGDSARLRLEKDLVNNKDLQDRLAVFALTRDDLISTKAKLPKHIEDLIDEQDRISNDDKVTRFSPSEKHSELATSTTSQDNTAMVFFKKHPLQSIAASVMFGLLIGYQGMSGMGASPYNDVLINRPIGEYQSISNQQEIFNKSSETIALQKHLTYKSADYDKAVIRLLKSLNRNKKASHIPASNNNKAINILFTFKNTANQECKLAETSDSYIIACINSSGKWTIKKVK